ncbi:MAG: hypothetical protein LBJ31_04065, partial [Treponema sp.]|nr:hypothetical protein [Treponema sp.]
VSQDISRYPVVNMGAPYWTASAQLDGATPYFNPAYFSDITYEGTTGYSRSYSIYEGPAAPGTTYDHDKRGIAPAFCVK